MRQWVWFVVAILVLLDAIVYSLGAIGPIRSALKSDESYWNKRLLLNLMLANQGMYLAGAIGVVGAVMETKERGSGVPFFGLTLATCIYTLVTVPIITPRDSAHVIPRTLAAALIIMGFTAP